MPTVKDLLCEALEDLSTDELKDFKSHLRQPQNGFRKIPKRHLEGTRPTEIAELMIQHYDKQAEDVAKIILEKIHRNDLKAEVFTNRNAEQTGPGPEENIQQHQQKLRSYLKGIFTRAREGVSDRNNEQNLAMVFTELYVTSGGEVHINQQHEIIQIQMKREAAEEPIKPSDIFKDPDGLPTRTVMTTGVAGIGKTFLVRKFVLDWAEGTNNQDIHLLFPLNFRELNLLKDKKFTLAKLIHTSIWESKAITEKELNHIFTRLQMSGSRDYESSDIKILFVLDGLDESRLHLDCSRHEEQRKDFDVMQSTSVDVLLTALIKGNLLPPARIWITTRPAAANQISRNYLDRMTLVRGFTDQQKVEYFKKKFPDKIQAERIITHIKASRSIFIMCHIPVFCWLITCVFKYVLKAKKKTDLPKTLTEMYTEFIVFQIATTEKRCSTKNSIKYIRALAKLAFQQLEKQDPIFYEKDLKDSGINFREAALYCGVFTEIFEEVREWRSDDGDKGRMFSFVHLSLQEYLAALHVIMSLFNNNKNVFTKPQLNTETLCTLCRTKSLQEVHEIALNRALKNQKGQLDLFLRFLLGLSLETNQNLLKRLLKLRKDDGQVNNKIIKSIKEKLRQDMCPERSINLFHCLNELKDESLLEEIQQYLRSGSLFSGNLSSTQWSALVFILLSSDDSLEVFDLKKYSASAEGLQRLLPVVKVSKKLLLNNCNLSKRSCEALALVLSSQSNSIRELDLSDNNLGDSGVKFLSDGLASPHCTLQSLRLSGCMITKDGCSYLASALKSKPHLKELDLSYNHPGQTGKTLLSDGLNPNCRLNLDYGGPQRLKPGLRKYVCDLKLDQNTAHRNLKLSDDCTEVTMTEDPVWYPHHPDRFDCWRQVLCSPGLTGRCYWEVQWTGNVYIAVTSRRIRRRGEGTDGCLGNNDHSWMLRCDEHGFSVRHEDRELPIDGHLSFASNRVAVFLDYPAGTLSFYKLVSGSLVHLYTFESMFTEPLYPAFGFGFESGLECNSSSVSLCEVEDVHVSSNC